MHFIHDLMHHIVQSYFWKIFLGSFQWIDWVIVLIAAAGIFYGIKRGLMREIAEIVETVIVFFLTKAYYESVAYALGTLFKKVAPDILTAVSFGVLALLVTLAMIFIDSVLRKWIQTKLISFLRILGGAILGCFHFLFLLSFILQAVLLLPLERFHKVFLKEESRFGYDVAQLAPRVYQWVLQPSFLLNK